MRPIVTQFPGLGCMDDLKTKRRVDKEATWVIDMLGLFLDMYSMGVCTTRQWQTAGRLVQEFDICTVHIKRKEFLPVLGFYLVAL